MGADTLSKDESIRLLQAEIERLRDDRDSWTTTSLKLEMKIGRLREIITQLQNEREAVIKVCVENETERLRGELDALQTHFDIVTKAGAGKDAEIERLRGFARRVLRVWPDGDLDGGDLQDAAVEAGLLVQRHVTEIPCGPDCQCMDYYDEDDLKAGRHVCYEPNREALGE